MIFMDRIKIALLGNPNSGKTTLFNDLTGSAQYVGNWPGVTVEKKEGRLKIGNGSAKEATVVDLPGIYSLSPYTLEEVVTRDFLINERPDVILNIVDASNLERNLYLTTQLLEVGIPVVVALNMMDVVNKNGDEIDLNKLSAALGCKAVETAAVRGTGSRESAQLAVAHAGRPAPQPLKFGGRVETALEQIEKLIRSDKSASYIPRWYAIKLFERDGKAGEQLDLSPFVLDQIEEIIKACEKELDDDSESIITNERYERVTDITASCLKKAGKSLSTSDKIDLVLTNRWLALPIFAAVMFIVYFISVSTVGTLVTDWTNRILFGEWISGGVSLLLHSAGAAEWLHSLLVDGIIGGVGAVLGFLPQMLILFFFLSVLEDCGYMARAAFIMDRIFRKFGLSGKSFIPMLISSGCGVPGIMASRTIENEKDRKMTIMVTTFIPCGAKLPIIALISGALFPKSAWCVAPSMYFAGVVMIILSGMILKKTKLFAGGLAPFVMELPQYHLPSAKNLMLHIYDRAKAFVIKAGTVIFLACGLIWFFSNFGWDFRMAEQDKSILAGIGHMIAPIFAPIGFGDWRAAVATLTGIAAKENVVSTLGVLLGLSDAAENDPTLLAGVAGMFTAVSAYAFMVFNMLCAPCVAAIGAIRREMGSAKWTLIAVGYQTLLAYIAAFLIYQLGSVVFLGAAVSAGTVAAVLVLAVLIWMLLRPDRNSLERKRG